MRLRDLYSESKKRLAQALSNDWGKYFVGAFVVAVIALLVAFVSSTGVKAAAITFAAVGTLTLWLIAALVIVYRETPPETGTHGVLLPANKPMPPNPCDGHAPANAFLFFWVTALASPLASPHDHPHWTRQHLDGGQKRRPDLGQRQSI